MTKRMTKTAAFAEYGITCKNVRWSWSGRSPDGQRVALTFWEDRFSDLRTKPILYDDTNWIDSSICTKPGNTERIENIRWALDHLNGEVGVVFLKAKDTKAEPRQIIECYARKDMHMRITDFDPDTGEWKAKSVT